MITPTVGRVVWFRERDDRGMQPYAAIIAYVHSDTKVNLMVIEPDGTTWGCENVELLQDNYNAADDVWCEWMPYQKGQAAKTEALEAKLEGGKP
jgi:hypothetical protein